MLETIRPKHMEIPGIMWVIRCKGLISHRPRNNGHTLVICGVMDMMWVAMGLFLYRR